MTHPIPQPRRSGGPRYRNLPTPLRNGPLAGPYCPHLPAARPGPSPAVQPAPQSSPQSSPACTHTSCRRRRAQGLLRLGGHRSEYAGEHSRAAIAQRCNPHLIVWFGEQTGSFWMVSPSGLAEVPDAATLDRLLGRAPVLA